MRPIPLKDFRPAWRPALCAVLPVACLLAGVSSAGAPPAAVPAPAPPPAPASAPDAPPAPASAVPPGPASAPTAPAPAPAQSPSSPLPLRSAHPPGSALPPGSVRSPLSVAEIRQAQERLLELGYWAGAADGRWSDTWRHALVAFQKVEWRKPTGVLNRAEWSELLRALPPAPRERGPEHIEVDLARQVFLMVDAAGVTSHILPVSSGSGRAFRAPAGWRATADTPCGHFTVFQRGSGWHKSELGQMYNPLYLVGGIAIHGSLDVPAKPVSHGCIRIPMYASRTLPHLVPREMPVLVYGCKDDSPPPPTPAAPVVAPAAAGAQR